MYLSQNVPYAKCTLSIKRMFRKMYPGHKTYLTQNVPLSIKRMFRKMYLGKKHILRKMYPGKKRIFRKMYPVQNNVPFAKCIFRKINNNNNNK